MIRNRNLRALVLAAGGLGCSSALAQRHELGLTLGTFTSGTRSSPRGSLELGSGTAFQANYGFKFLQMNRAALFGEVHFLANPLRDIASPNVMATRDVATLFAVPGIRMKFHLGAGISPYVAAGAGYALYEQSLFRIDGNPNPAPRFTHRGAFGFGGGADFRVWRFLGGRLEVRDFYTGNPSFNGPAPGGGQHNIVVGGGFVLHFGQEER